MTDWTIVLWNDARQIAEHAGLPKESWPDNTVAPRTFFESLRADGELGQAALFMASSLPRLEAIMWINKILPQPDGKHPNYNERRSLRDMAHRWVGDPDDDNRRAIFKMAENSDAEWAETLLGLAIFFSGGSIAPPDLTPVLPEPHVAAHLAAAALQSAAIEWADTDEGLMDRALDIAHEIAVNGRESLHAK